MTLLFKLTEYVFVMPQNISASSDIIKILKNYVQVFMYRKAGQDEKKPKPTNPPPPPQLKKIFSLGISIYSIKYGNNIGYKE